MSLKINFDYLKILEEVPLFCAAILRHDFRRKGPPSPKTILIVNVSLVGEFASTIPVIHECIMRYPSFQIDLMVSPPLAPLARKVRGVRHVFSAPSVFDRVSEQGHTQKMHRSHYGKIILMRISPDAYAALAHITSDELMTALPHLLKYGAHIFLQILRRRTPRSWREVNYRIFDLPPRVVPVDAIFDFNPSDRARIEARPEFQIARKKIAIHTGASWPMNRWNLDKWIYLLSKINEKNEYEYIFVGGVQDTSDFAYISSHLPFPASSLIGKTDLVDLPIALSLCDFFIGVDSGPRNMAHLVDLPSVTILGPGPHMYTPPNPRDIVVDRSNGRGLLERYLFRNGNGCIDKISVDDAYQAFVTLRERTGASTTNPPSQGVDSHNVSAI